MLCDRFEVLGKLGEGLESFESSSCAPLPLSLVSLVSRTGTEKLLVDFDMPLLRTPQLHFSSAARKASKIFQDPLGGAFASVWLCGDKKLNLVALKVSMTQPCFRCHSRHAERLRASIVHSCID